MFIGIFSAAFLIHPPQASLDWASWAQAVGSIGAVGVAILVTYLRSINERKLEKARVDQAYDERFGIWEGIVSETCSYIFELPSAALEGQAALKFILDPHKKASFIVLSEALDSIDTEKVKPFPLRGAILELRRATKVCIKLFPSPEVSVQKLQLKWMTFADEIKQCRGIADNANDVFESYRRAYQNKRR